MDINIENTPLNVQIPNQPINIQQEGQMIYENDHNKLTNKNLNKQHNVSTIEGLDQSGDGTRYLSNDGTYKEVIMPEVPVEDVKVDGTSVVDENGVANVVIPDVQGQIIVDYFSNLPTGKAVGTKATVLNLESSATWMTPISLTEGETATLKFVENSTAPASYVEDLNIISHAGYMYQMISSAYIQGGGLVFIDTEGNGYAYVWEDTSYAGIPLQANQWNLILNISLNPTGMGTVNYSDIPFPTEGEITDLQSTAYAMYPYLLQYTSASWETPTSIQDGETITAKYVETPTSLGSEVEECYIWVNVGNDLEEGFLYMGEEIATGGALIYMKSDGNGYVYVWQNVSVLGMDLTANTWNYILNLMEEPSYVGVVDYSDIPFPTTGTVVEIADDANLLYSNMLLFSNTPSIKKAGEYQFSGNQWNYLPYNAVETTESGTKFLSGDGSYKTIDIPEVHAVLYDTNAQGLTSEQQNNARTNISAVPTSRTINSKTLENNIILDAVDVGAISTSSIVNGTGHSDTSVMSQFATTTALSNKQDLMPNGINPLIISDTMKINAIYIPASVLGGITNGGTFDGSGIITASMAAPQLQGMLIDNVQLSIYPSYFFICSAPYSFAGFDYAVGDWALSLGSGWAKLNATDAVTSVNGKMGQVVLTYLDVGAVQSAWGSGNINKNLVTDSNGNVTLSEYPLGQIIANTYMELPTGVPPGTEGYVKTNSSGPILWSNADVQLAQGDELDFIGLAEVPTYVDESESGVIDDLLDFNSGGHLYRITLSDSEGFAYRCLVLRDFNNTLLYAYSWFNNSIFGLSVPIGWSRINYYAQTVEPITYADVPYIYDVTIVNVIGPSYINQDIYIPEPKLLGTYRYTQILPATDPVTYYWKFEPSNVQSDWNIIDPNNNAYIKNKITAKNGVGTGALIVANTSQNEARGNYSFSANMSSKANGGNSFAILAGTTTSENAFAAGMNTTVSGLNAYALGIGNNVSGNNSKALGSLNTLPGEYQSAIGIGLSGHSNINRQNLLGRYNEVVNNRWFIVGCGTSNNDRKNAFTIDDAGNLYNKDNNLLATTNDIKSDVVTQNLTLTASGWDATTKTQKVLITLDTTHLNEIIPTLASLEDWGDYGILPTLEETTGITFKCNIIPLSDITFSVDSKEVDYA